MFRLAIFSDTFDEINGVTTIYRQFLEAAEQADVPSAQLAVFCLAEQSGMTKGVHTAVFRYRPRPHLPLPRYPELRTGFAPVWSIERDFDAWQAEHGAFDAVLVATPGPFGFTGQTLAKRYALPLVGFYHTRFPAYLAVYGGSLLRTAGVGEWLERVGYVWMRQLYDACELVICQSPSIADEVRRVSSGRIAVWDTGVDLAAFRPGPDPAFRARYGIPPDAVVVSYVGRLAAEKSLDVLAALSHRLPERRFLVVGDGPYADTLRADANAIFTGFLHGEDLTAAYRASDIFFFPSATDTFGNVLLEAMASGLPLVVVADGPGADLVATTQAGSTYPVDDVAAAAAAVETLAGDAALRTTMARRGLAHVAERGWPAALDRFIALCAEEIPAVVA